MSACFDVAASLQHKLHLYLSSYEYSCLPVLVLIMSHMYPAVNSTDTALKHITAPLTKRANPSSSYMGYKASLVKTTESVSDYYRTAAMQKGNNNR
eukprot:scaffold489081_cov32-Prasinocladus_malaysianus.AAC.1